MPPPAVPPESPRQLTLPFRPDTRFHVSEGWRYTEEEQAIHGFDEHKGVDFATALGTSVVSATPGYAAATYQLERLDRHHRGRRVNYGYGRLVMVWHPEAHILTLYGHLSSINDSVPYVKPRRLRTGWYADMLKWEPPDFVTNGHFVERGQEIGAVGVSGLGWGVPEGPKRLPTRSWDEPHLHFEVRVRGRPVDPFGIGGTAERYNPLPAGTLWRLGPDGKPAYAK